MFNWLSNYDYDYALAAVPVSIILLLFYSSRRNLPIRQSLSFSVVMILNLIMTIVDIVSCEMNEIFMNYPLWIMYLVNMIYFITFIGRGWALFDYTAESCREYKILDARSRFLAALPAIGVMILILITPWFSTIFTFDQTGYHNCSLYRSIYICTYFYIAVSYICIFACLKNLSRRISTGLLAYNTVLLLGLILRKVLYGNYLITSYVSMLAILIIYITSENPDLYRDPRIKLFNKEAFDIIGINYLERNQSFHCVAGSIYNYETAKVLYGAKQLSRSLRKTGESIIRNFPDYYAFYFGNGNFLMLKKGRAELGNEELIDSWKKQSMKIRELNKDEVSFTLATMVLPYATLKDNLYQINDLLDFVFLEAYNENQKGNYIFDDQMLSRLLREKAVEAALNKALEEHSLKAYFQPIYSIKENKIVGTEALARLYDPKIGYIPPLEFVAVAEKNGDIMELGRQIFSQVCEFAQNEKLRERGIEFINVNLSPAQCLNSMLAQELSDIAAQHEISMNMIDFEITESAAEDFLSIQKQMYLLQQEGAELSLDDFGAGTSNLTRLMHLPIHVVKIDIDVALAYFNNEAPFLPDLIKMFKHANMKIVVEGIETKEMKDALSKMECDYLQGFYFARALPGKEFIEFIENNKDKRW